MYCPLKFANHNKRVCYRYSYSQKNFGACSFCNFRDHGFSNRKAPNPILLYILWEVYLLELPLSLPTVGFLSVYQKSKSLTLFVFSRNIPKLRSSHTLKLRYAYYLCSYWRIFIFFCFSKCIYWFFSVKYLDLPILWNLFYEISHIWLIDLGSIVEKVANWKPFVTV